MLRFKYQSILLFLSIVFISAIFSCSSSEEKAVKDAIKRYGAALRDVYIKTDLSILEDIATNEQINKVMHLVQALIDRNTIMVTEQKRLNIKSVKIQGDTAEAETEETWIYWLEDKYNKNVIKSSEDVHYRLVYRLKKIQGKWKVGETREIK